MIGMVEGNILMSRWFEGGVVVSSTAQPRADRAHGAGSSTHAHVHFLAVIDVWLSHPNQLSAEAPDV
jgi:hypothetical protein